MIKRVFRMGFLACGIVLASGLSATASAQESPYNFKSGKEVYENICQGCHMPDAKGATGAGAYPALAGNAKLVASIYPVLVILQGLKSMPSFPELTDEQIAAVTNYIRSSYGNNFADKVTVEQVKEFRSQAVHRQATRPG